MEYHKIEIYLIRVLIYRIDRELSDSDTAIPILVITNGNY